MKRGEFVSKIKETGIDIRPFVADQVRRYIEDHPKAKDSEFSAAGYVLNEVMRACEHVSRRKMLAESERSLSDDGRVSDYFENIVKSWGRMDDPSRRGKPRLAEDTFLWFFRHVEDTSYFTEVARHVWPNTSEAFMRFVYAKCGGSGDPNYKPAQTRFKADIEEVRREFRNLWIQKAPRVPMVRLGPISISLFYDVNLIQLSLQEPVNQNFLVDGQPDIFKALDWRSRLTPRHGHAGKYEQLLNWALDTKIKAPRVMLVSGPGGVGKTRLVADVVSKLVKSHGWSGGFLPRGVSDTDVLDGSGNGVALIIDSPEERSDLVEGILTAIEDDMDCHRPIRIILASRENLHSWKDILNSSSPDQFEELMLGEEPFLSIKDAQKVVEDVRNSYSKHVGKLKPELNGVKKWLELHYSHRLPLMTLAASVYAVHKPENAFALSGKDILLELAKIEMKRVRSYSKREFRKPVVLEKLLALSLFTSNGLSKDTIYALGNAGFCSGLNADEFLQAVQNTPFWQEKTRQRGGHLIQLKPDRPAAAFMYLALKLVDSSPALPEWMAMVLEQGGKEFGDILARISMDIGCLDPTASQTLEKTAIQMLDRSPKMVDQLGSLAYQPSSVFSAKFSLALCQKLALTADEIDKAFLCSKIAQIFMDAGRYEDALNYTKNSIALYNRSYESAPESFGQQMGNALVQNSIINFELENFYEAALRAEQAMDVFRALMKHFPGAFQADFSHALVIHARTLAGIGRIRDALKIGESALHISKILAETNPNRHFLLHENVLQTLTPILFEIGQFERALELSEEAVEISDRFANERPEMFNANLAKSLSNKATMLHNLNRSEEAIQPAEEALSMFEFLAEARPDSYLLDFALMHNKLNGLMFKCGRYADALSHGEIAEQICQRTEVKPSDLAMISSDLAAALGGMEHFEEAVKRAHTAIEIYRDLSETESTIYQTKLAVSLSNSARWLCKLEREDDALKLVEEAATLLMLNFLRYPDRYKDWMLPAFTLYVQLCEYLKYEPKPELVEPIIECVKGMK